MDVQVSAADVRIQSMSSTARFVKGGRVELTVQITLYSDNDDDARSVQCVVVMPPTSHVVSSIPPAVVGPAFGALGPPDQFIQSESTNGYVVFDLDDPMHVGASKDLELVLRVHESWAGRPIAAFVFGSVPDPDPGNNCAVAQATLPAKP